jgi:hypothetical protein
MKIGRNSIITLADGRKFYILNGARARGVDFCLLMSVEGDGAGANGSAEVDGMGTATGAMGAGAGAFQPQLLVGKLTMDGDKVTASVYDGADYKEILLKFLKV